MDLYLFQGYSYVSEYNEPNFKWNLAFQFQAIIHEANHTSKLVFQMVTQLGADIA